MKQYECVKVLRDIFCALGLPMRADDRLQRVTINADLLNEFDASGGSVSVEMLDDLGPDAVVMEDVACIDIVSARVRVALHCTARLTRVPSGDDEVFLYAAETLDLAEAQFEIGVPRDMQQAAVDNAEAVLHALPVPERFVDALCAQRAAVGRPLADVTVL